MISNILTTLVTDDAMGLIDFSAGSSNTVNARISGLVVGTSEAGGSLAIETRTDGGSLTEKFRITGAGNVGIGTTSPAFLTEIVGGTTTVETTLFQIRSNAGGIGTGSTIAFGNSTNPTAGSGRVELAALRTTSSGASFVIRAGDDSGTIQERMRITSTGLVGIGTTSPNAKLQVTTSSFPVLKVADELGGGAIALGDAAISSNYVGIWRGAANSISGGGFLNIQGNNIAFMSTDAVFGSATRTMTLDNAGNLALGISSGYRTATGYVALAINATSGSLIDLYASGTRHGGVGATGGGMYVSSVTATPLIFSTTDTERMRIDSSGNVGIGTTANNYRLNVKGGGTVGDSSVYAQFTTLDTGTTATDGLLIGLGVGSSPAAYFGQYENAPVIFLTNGTEKMRITSGGNVLIGTTTITDANQALLVLQAAYPKTRMEIRNDGETGALYAITFYNGNGLIGSITTSGSATSFNTSSDQRLKTNIVNAPLGNIDDIKVRSFDWIADGSHQEYGMVAQELIEVAPYAVNKPENPDEMMGIDYSKLVPMMIKEIQNLKSLIESMATKLKDAGVAGF
jgi:hypothetical protein